ncbi:MAG: V-type ATP synthase subunit B [Candidatus Limnocylindrales bacterium]
MRAPVEYSTVTSAKGPLVVVEGTGGDVGWDEFAEIRLASGEMRHGVVLELDHDLAVVQVMEGTAGLDPRSCRIGFVGHPLAIPVTEAWLGRECNGRGDPIDGGPPILSSVEREVTGFAINPMRRDTPSEPVITGVSVVDALTTVVRGQKLPIFSVGGLPHLELAVQIAAQARVGDAPFRVVFGAMGITHADVAAVRAGLQEREAAGELVLVINTAADPVVERLLTPRLALTIAEHLAFDLGFHVLVVLVDMTNYCEALREIAAARGDVPTRGGYPGYLYSDLASIYERCGRIRDRPGSITEIPVLSMPGGDITHPVPDLSGYITEGQLVMSADAWARGIYPPVDVLPSLSRLMRRGTGDGKTRADHPAIAAQLYASLAQAQRAQEMAELLGVAALSPTDRRYLDLADAFDRRLMTQGASESRTMEDTLDRAWEVASILPRRELTMVSRSQVEAFYQPDIGSESDAGGRAAVPEAGPQPAEG